MIEVSCLSDALCLQSVRNWHCTALYLLLMISRQEHAGTQIADSFIGAITVLFNIRD